EPRVRRLVRRSDVGDERLQGHAAFGTRAWLRTPDFGVHRARIDGVDGAGIGVRDSGFGIRGSGLGMRRELFQAADLEDRDRDISTAAWNPAPIRRRARACHWTLLGRAQVSLRVGTELRDAPLRAEVI